MSEEDESSVVPNLERLDDWVLLPEDPNSWGYKGDYFVVWVAETPPDASVIEACKALQKDSLAFPAFTVRMVETPSFGLIANSKNTIGFEDATRAKATLEKIIWEIQRLSR